MEKEKKPKKIDKSKLATRIVAGVLAGLMVLGFAASLIASLLIK